MKTLFKNIRIKTLIGSLIFAVILWIFVVLSKDYETTIRIPVIINNVPENSAFSSKVPEHIIANLKGQGKNLILLKYFLKSEFNFEVDKALNPNLNIIEQKDFSKFIKIPRGFSELVLFEFISPDRIDLRIEPKLSINVPISSDNIKINPNEGYLTYLTQIDPSSVKLEGPERLIRKIKDIKTEDISFVDKKRSFPYEIKLIIPEAVSSDITKTKIFVEVSKIEGN
ncbi:CdaR family protein [candidate division KSB1 bacterium]